MKEELITFETAKLAKEKGFHHMKANCYGDNMCYQLPEGELTNALKGNVVTGYILAPTQSLLVKWFREMHKIHVVVLPLMEEDGGTPIYYNVSVLVEEENPSHMEFDQYSDHMYNIKAEKYEVALEKGLREALKEI